MRTRNGIALAAALLAAAALSAPAIAAAPAAPKSPGGKLAGVTRADTARVMRAVRKLADPKWEGRGVGTAGLDSAAAWIASEFARLGLRPAGDGGGWLQQF